jgi:hypothetical protein
MRTRRKTREEIAAAAATEIWYRPLPANPEKLALSPLFTGKPYAEDERILTPGHSVDCGCSDCYAAYCFSEAVR